MTLQQCHQTLQSGMLGGLIGLATLATPAMAQPARQPDVDRTLAAWTLMWNRYDLDQVDQLFVTAIAHAHFANAPPAPPR